jgi:hypothetical protein
LRWIKVLPALTWCHCPVSGPSGRLDEHGSASFVRPIATPLYYDEI